MKRLTVAVFGHYDSRGGTSAYIMDDRSPEEFERCCKRYLESFCWDDIILDARAAKDKGEPWDWDPADRNSTPAANDFLFIADLHYSDGLDLMKLSPRYSGQAADLQDTGAVLIDTATEPDFGEPPESIMGERYDDWTLDEKFRTSAAAPTQLEFVWLDTTTYAHQQLVEKDDLEHAAMLVGMAQVLTGESVEFRDWDDDAFGFLLIAKEDR